MTDQLIATLTALLANTGTATDFKILILLESTNPKADNYSFCQLLATLSTYAESIVVFVRPAGIRAIRDKAIELCSTSYLLMLDDDVVLGANSLFAVSLAATEMFTSDKPVAYVVGAKVDTTNNRGYGDYSSAARDASACVDYCGTNFFYRGCEFGKVRLVKTVALDTGLALFNVPLIREYHLSFHHYQTHATFAGGEDSMFALQAHAKNLLGWFCPEIQAYHLGKSKVNFDEFSARKEMLLRMADLLNVDAREVADKFFRWVPTTSTEP